jgi:hypothetical protein
MWLNAIDSAWPNLALNEALRAGRSHVKYHLLFAVSALIAAINKQGALVPDPGHTMTALASANEILPLAANCVDRALQNAVNQSQMAGKIFSPQNWLKSVSSVQDQTLVAGTVASMLPGFPNYQALQQAVCVPSNAFSPRWSAE